MALGDGIGREKGVSHWSYGRKRDFCLGAEAMLSMLVTDSKFAACVLDTDENRIINDCGFIADMEIYSIEDIMEYFRKEKKLNS